MVIIFIYVCLSIETQAPLNAIALKLYIIDEISKFTFALLIIFLLRTLVTATLIASLKKHMTLRPRSRNQPTINYARKMYEEISDANKHGRIICTYT